MKTEQEIKVWVQLLPDTIIGYDSEGDSVSIGDYYDCDIHLEPSGFEMDPESGYDFWCEVDEFMCETFCDEDLEYEGGYDNTNFILYPIVDGEILWDIILYDVDGYGDVMYNGEIVWEKVVEETTNHPIYKNHMREKRLTDLLGE